MREPRSPFRPTMLVRAGLLLMGTVSALATDWQSVNSGLGTPESRTVRVLAVDPLDPTRIYAGTDAGVFRTTDGGAAWRPAGLGDPVHALAIDFLDPSTLYAVALTKSQGPYRCSQGAASNFSRSTDGGTTWTQIYGNNTCLEILAIATEPAKSGGLYITTYVPATGDWWSLDVSRDGGVTWKQFFGPLLAALALDPLNPDTLFGGTLDSSDPIYEAGLGYGVLKSTDGGATWSRTGLTRGAVSMLAVDPNTPGRVYAATRGLDTRPRGFTGLLKSADGGDTWTAIDAGLSHLVGTSAIVTSLVIDPRNPDLLYAGTAGMGVFRSSDGGAGWKPFNQGLVDLDVRSLVVARGTPDGIYAGTAGGVFRMTEQAPALTVDSPYRVGSSWRLRVDGAAAEARVRLLGTSDGRAWEIPSWGRTDASGLFGSEGVFPESAQGNHTLRVEVDGVLSSVVVFAVLPRQTGSGPPAPSRQH